MLRAAVEVRGLRDEANVPAQQPEAEEGPRVPRADEDLRRPPGSEAAASEGPQAPDRLNCARRQRFPSACRLRKRSEFQKVYESGARVAGARIVLFVLPRDENGPRLGLTATRKVGGAVVRNRMRRLVREAFRRHRDLVGRWDLVVNIRQAAVGSTYPVIEQEFVALVGRARKRLETRPPAEGPSCRPAS
jgi:ribonuclease P protein component